MRVTSKGQVTIPKEIRDHLGILPGSEVDFVRGREGVRLVPVDRHVPEEEASRRFKATLDEMADTLDLGGMTADEYMEWLRGPREDLDLD